MLSTSHGTALGKDASRGSFRNEPANSSYIPRCRFQFPHSDLISTKYNGGFEDIIQNVRQTQVAHSGFVPANSESPATYASTFNEVSAPGVKFKSWNVIDYLLFGRRLQKLAIGAVANSGTVEDQDSEVGGGEEKTVDTGTENGVENGARNGDGAVERRRVRDVEGLGLVALEPGQHVGPYRLQVCSI